MEMRNPFITIGRIPHECFCDRREESKRIVRTLTNGGNVCLMAPRRIGKSKLICYCFESEPIAGDYYTFYVDIFHTTCLSELAYTLGKEVFDVLKSANVGMREMVVRGLKSVSAKLGFDAMTGLPTFALELGDLTRPEYTLKEIFECLENADKPCIVAIDEFQQTGNYVEKNVEALLRSHIQHLGNVHFVFSGSERHLLAEMFQSSARPFYNSTDVMELKPIAKEVYVEFVEKMFGLDERRVEEKDIEMVYDLMCGNTYYMQKVFREAFAMTARGENPTREMLINIIGLMVEDASEGFRRELSRVPERSKQLLYAIAHEGRARRVMSGQFIKKHSLASASSVQAAIKKLSEYDLISEEDGEYYICDALLRMWIVGVERVLGCGDGV